MRFQKIEAGTACILIHSIHSAPRSAKLDAYPTNTSSNKTDYRCERQQATHDVVHVPARRHIDCRPESDLLYMRTDARSTPEAGMWTYAISIKDSTASL